MDSWGTLTSLKDDLESYIDSNYGGSVPYFLERNPLSLEDQDGMSKIAGMRVSIYEQPEDVLIRVGASNAKDWNQAYQVQLFMRVPREGDLDYNIEQQVMDFKDLVWDWQDQIDANAVASELYTLQWDSVSEIIRQPSFSSMDINLGAYRSQI